MAAKSTSHDPEFVSTREAANLLGVALRTAQLWVESGVLRAWKTAGGHRRILRSSVDAVLAARRESVKGPASGPAAFKVVVVEDEPALLKLYQLKFADWGLPIELITATNGFEGLIRIGETRPQLLITDLNMPGMDGFRMIRSLRNSTEFRDLKIVAVTALGKAEIADRGGLPEDVTVFTKPVPFSEFEKLLRGALTAKRK